MPLYAATIILSAFLLFLVQPLIARQILPWFGGSAAVWTTCMVFFQSMLLAGYAYSDFIAHRLAPRAQAIAHGALLLASLVFLPIVAAANLKPIDADNPIGRILWLLLASVGLPYLLLATTGPLVQAWFARAHPGRSVYRLYALSNVGSVLALASYPLLIEPLASSGAQALGWSAAYVLFALLAGTCAWVSARRSPPVRAGTATPVHSQVTAGPHAATQPPPHRGQTWRWFLLPMLGSVLLLAVTAHITQDVAPIPLLWVLPLALYLGTFILTFDGRRWYWRRTYLALAALLPIPMLAGLEFRIGDDGSLEAGILPVGQAVALYGAGLFALCMFCHGELYRSRPEPARLTRFYLLIALGGACGGLLVGLVAPLAFPAYLEMPLVLVAIALVAWRASTGPARWAAMLAVPVCAALLTWHLMQLTQRSIAVERSFYGALRIERTAPAGDPDEARAMLHGVILHGVQWRDAARRALPTTYYSEASGVGRAIEALRPAALRIGVIGLGVGTLASYGRPGDSLRFYELAPDVARAARRHFTYLQDTAAEVQLVLGDGRLSLEREPPQRFDLLVVDAFSSDAIPLHLLTREAMQAYGRHLAPHGVLAFHVTNRYLELAPMVRALADSAALHAWRFDHEPQPPRRHVESSAWVLVSGERALLERIGGAGRGAPIAPVPGLRAWSDDYGNLLQVLR